MPEPVELAGPAVVGPAPVVLGPVVVLPVVPVVGPIVPVVFGPALVAFPFELESVPDFASSPLQAVT